MDDIPGDVLEEVAQLTKANSIKGSKLTNINIVYTPHSNLRKTSSMAVGQVEFLFIIYYLLLLFFFFFFFFFLFALFLFLLLLLFFFQKKNTNRF